MQRLPIGIVLSGLETSAAARVASFLESVDHGYPFDLRSPFIDKSAPREEIIDDWKGILGTTGLDYLDSLEQDQASKIGPISIREPYKSREELVLGYFQRGKWEPDESALLSAVGKVVEMVSQHLRPTTLETAYGRMPKGTNLGLPVFSSDDEYEIKYLERAQALDTSGYVDGHIYPAVVGWRGQPRGLHLVPKQRTVWMEDHLETILGLTVLHPILGAMRSRGEFAAWRGPDDVDVEVTYLLRTASFPLLSVDFSSFDQSVGRELIQMAFHVFQLWMPTAAPRIRFLERAFTGVPLLTPRGLLTGRSGAVPSGSALTNLVDSVVQLIIAHYVAERMGSSIRAITVLGDDGVWSFDDPYDVEDVVNHAAELGMTISPEKSAVSGERASYLQRVHSLKYLKDGIAVGVRSTMRTLGSMISYERYKRGWNGFMDSVRWIMQVENTKWHPSYEDFVRFLYKGDKLVRRHDPSVILARAGGAERAESLLGIASFPYGSHSVHEWSSLTTVNILRSIREESGR
jgi:hypothetical protein